MLCCGYTLTDFPISIRLTSLALWQSNDCPSASKATLMNMDKYFMWINYERLHNHNKAKHNKTVCIFLGIYCNVGYGNYFSKIDIFIMELNSWSGRDQLIIIDIWMKSRCLKVHQTKKSLTPQKSDIIAVQYHATRKITEILTQPFAAIRKWSQDHNLVQHRTSVRNVS